MQGNHLAIHRYSLPEEAHLHLRVQADQVHRLAPMYNDPVEVQTYSVRLEMPVFRNQPVVPMRTSHRAVQVISDHLATQARSNLQEDPPEEDSKKGVTEK